MGKGFVLIELLVVVLVIGILAAVAFPQYEKAVLKSRLESALPTLRTLKEQSDRYYMANGQYQTETVTAMMVDVNMTGCRDIGNVVLKCNSVYYDIHTAAGLNNSFDVAVLLTDGENNIRLGYGIMLDHASSDPNRHWCGAKPDDNIAQSICRELGGSFVKTGKCTHSSLGGTNACNIYLLPGCFSLFVKQPTGWWAVFIFS